MHPSKDSPPQQKTSVGEIGGGAAMQGMHAQWSHKLDALSVAFRPNWTEYSPVHRHSPPSAIDSRGTDCPCAGFEQLHAAPGLYPRRPHPAKQPRSVGILPSRPLTHNSTSTNYTGKIVHTPTWGPQRMVEYARIHPLHCDGVLDGSHHGSADDMEKVK